MYNLGLLVLKIAFYNEIIIIGKSDAYAVRSRGGILIDLAEIDKALITDSDMIQNVEHVVRFERNTALLYAIGVIDIDLISGLLHD